ncbi:hypothetical protein [Phenylobacterium sp.]
MTFFPVPPVRPVTLARDEAAQKAAEAAAAPRPPQSNQTTGRLFDFKV